jgi:drug/metabolite transporter, DME family
MTTIPTPIQRPLLGAGILLTTAVIWSFFGILVRLLGYNIPFFYGALVRNLAAALILGGILWYSRQYKPMTRRDLLWSIARTTIGVLSLIGNFAGFVHLPIGTAYFIYFGGLVIGGFLLGKVLFGEQLTPLKIFSLVIAFIGMLLVYQFSFDVSLVRYMVIIFLAGLTGSFWTIAAKKISHQYSAIQLNALDTAVFAVLAFVLSLLYQESWVLPGLTVPWIANLLLLLMILVTGQLIILGFKHIDAQRGSLILLLEIALGTLLGALFFREHPSTLAIIGGALIIVAAALPEVSELVKSRTVVKKPSH